MTMFRTTIWAIAALAFRAGPAAALTYSVTTTADSGPGSLRAAMAAANAHVGHDTITFNLGASKTIAPTSPLPVITSPVDINATSQPGWTGNPIVELSGQNLNGAHAGLRVSAQATTIRGLIINRFPGLGIDIGASGFASTVKGCWIGTDLTGTQDRGNGGSGISVYEADFVTIGGPTPADRNVVSGNANSGIVIWNGAMRAMVTSNHLGTNAAGTAAIPNGDYGLRLLADEATIGKAGAGNVISGNGRGVEIAGDDNVVQANKIGTSAAGSAVLSNGQNGVDVRGHGNQIGVPGTGNVIGGSQYQGITLSDAYATSIRSNAIGTAANWSTPLPNGQCGVRVFHAVDTVIQDNVIANNDWYGVLLENTTGTELRGNRMWSNGEWGIDIEPYGPTPNDPLDADFGPNRTQNFPALLSAQDQNGTVTVDGVLDSTPSSSFRIELFGNTACHPSGTGEGRTPLGTVSVTTDANGHAMFSKSVALPAGQGVVTATATDTATKETSEFSPCLSVGSPTPGTLMFSSPYFLGHEPAGSATVAVVRTGGTVGAVSVDYATGTGSATPNMDYAPVAGTLTFGPGEALKTFSVPVFEDGVPGEPQESVDLSLTNPTGGAAIAAPATVPLHIFNYEGDYPLATVSDATAMEGDGGVQSLVFSVSVSQWDTPITLTVKTVPGSATEDDDYTAVEQTLVFQPGDAPKTLTVPVVGDVLEEGDEFVYLRIFDLDPGGVLRAVGQGVILDDDGAVGPSSPNALCQSGASLSDTRLRMRGFGDASGNESLTLRSRLDVDADEPSGTTPLAIDAAGAQLLVEDLTTGLPLLDLTGVAAIPAGLAGTSSCDPDDGWKVDAAGTTYAYTNRTNGLPPACAPGSAHGVRRLVVRDRRSKGAGVGVKLTLARGTLPAPVGPLRTTVVLGNGGVCGGQDGLPCTTNASGTAATCR